MNTLNEWTIINQSNISFEEKKCIYVCKKYNFGEKNDDTIYFSLNNNVSPNKCLFKLYVDEGQQYVYLKIRESYYFGRDDQSYDYVCYYFGLYWKSSSDIYVYGEDNKINSDNKLIKSTCDNKYNGN